jgi:hypothetical protein
MQNVSLRRPLGFLALCGLFLLLLLPSLSSGQTGQTTRRPDLGKFTQIDIQANANQPRKGNFHNNQPENTLAELSAGNHQLLGIPFEVGDRVLQLGSTIQKGMPEKLEVKVGKKFTTISVLQGAGWGVNEGQITIGNYILHYDDGSAHKIPIVNRQDTFAFWKRPNEKEQITAKEAWVGSNPRVKDKGFQIRLFVATWENPWPGKTVVRIEFVSTMTQSSPFCVAMTVADPLQPKAPAKPLASADLDQLWNQLAGEGSKACAAVETLAGAPAQAISFLVPRLQPPGAAPVADAKKIASLIVKLDDESFSEREAASLELQKLGPDAIPQLRRAAEVTKSAEVRQRAQELLDKLHAASATVSPERRRLLAVLCVLELIASDESLKALNEVAAGKAGALLAEEAGAALKRLKKK